jgi:hypothetical protein
MASDDQRRTATWQAVGRLLQLQSAARASERETEAALAGEQPQPTESFVPHNELGSGEVDEDTRAYATWVRNARRLAAANTFSDRRTALEAELREDAAATVQARWRARQDRHPTLNALGSKTDAPGRSHVAEDAVQPGLEVLEAGLNEDATSTVRVRARPAFAAAEPAAEPAVSSATGEGEAEGAGEAGGGATWTSERAVGSVAPLHARCSAQAATDEEPLEDAPPPQQRQGLQQGPQQAPQAEGESGAQPAVAITITDV